jgi:transposase
MGKIISKEIKNAYVEQILLKKITAPQAAKELKVHEATVYEWVKKFKQNPGAAFPGSGNQRPEDEGIHKLKAENKRLQDEIDFLKNVTAYFAKGHGKNTL